MSRIIAIIGGGFSGAMLAARLAEAGVNVRLINRDDRFGLGVAYSTTCDSHVLNVRSGRMSARADDPGHFVRWLTNNHPDRADPEGFVPRRIYGDYVRDTLAQAEAAHPGRIARIVGEVVAIEGEAVHMADGRRIEANAVVLATGNPPPRTASAEQGEAVIPDPWAPGALDRVRPTDAVVVIGTGLTMIDMVLALEDRGWIGQATALSRRGLVPRAHDPVQTHVPPADLPVGPLSERLAEGRRRARAAGWAEAMDGLRSRNAEQWADLDTVQRARFLRHMRPWWDVHRHRIASGPAARIARLIESGRLDVNAGRVVTVRPRPGGVAVEWTPRGQAGLRRMEADRLIDCTGPGHDPARSRDPLMRQLLKSGQGRPDALGLGLDVAPDGRLIDKTGVPADARFVLGPPALAAYWETVAVPDIRERIASLAALLTTDFGGP